MKCIKTFVINLEKSIARRKYMEELLVPYDFLDVEFIKAVNGRELSEKDKQSRFNKRKCIDLIGRELNDGEIGCTLSHRTCCEALLKSNKPYALIFEDDISIVGNLNIIKDIDLESILNTQKPKALMLSGDYWYWKKNKVLVNVYDCIGTYAYIINRAAAQCILSTIPANVSDNWMYYKHHGLKIYALFPYLVDANLNMDSLASDINQYSWGIRRSKMSWINIIRNIRSGVIKRILKKINHYEAKIKVLDGKVMGKEW